RTTSAPVSVVSELEAAIPVHGSVDLQGARAGEVARMAAVRGQALQPVGVHTLAQGRDRLVEGGAARGSGLLQQFGKAVQGVGDRGGQRGIDQLGQGREVDVFAS